MTLHFSRILFSSPRFVRAKNQAECWLVNRCATFPVKARYQGRVFKHPEEGLLLFRQYRDDEAAEMPDLVYTRKFLDLRGVIEANDFDATLFRANTPA